MSKEGNKEALEDSEIWLSAGEKGKDRKKKKNYKVLIFIKVLFLIIILYDKDKSFEIIKIFLFFFFHSSFPAEPRIFSRKIRNYSTKVVIFIVS